MRKPKVSVIIPVYNAEKYLKRCLDSVMNQTFKDIEIVLVDDGSKDGSGRLCDEIKATDDRITVIHQQNSGTGVARNHGLEAARGEYASFVDSDDYIELDMYEKLNNFIKDKQDETCIFGLHKVKDGKITSTKTNALSGTYKDQDALKTIFLNVLGTEPDCYDDFRILWQSPCLSLYSMEIIKKHNVAFPSKGEFVKLNEDLLFNIDYYIHAKSVTVLNEPFYYYCTNPNSSSTSFNEDEFLLTKKIYQLQLTRLREYLKDDELFENAKIRAQRIFLADVRNDIMYISRIFPYKDGRKRILEICNSPELREIHRVYPWQKNPFKYRIFNYFVKQKNTLALYLLCAFHRTIKS